MDLARELKKGGFRTILGGPQAREDYEGEPGTDAHPHRFKGLKSIIDMAFQGPVDGLRSEDLDARARALQFSLEEEPVPRDRLVKCLYVFRYSQEAGDPVGPSLERDWLPLCRQAPDRHPSATHQSSRERGSRDRGAERGMHFLRCFKGQGLPRSGGARQRHRSDRRAP